MIDRVAAPNGHAWRPLREVSSDDVLWSVYVTLMLGGYEPPVRSVDVWSFGNKPEMAAQLAHLVCTARSVQRWAGSTPPRATGRRWPTSVA